MTEMTMFTRYLVKLSKLCVSMKLLTELFCTILICVIIFSREHKGNMNLMFAVNVILSIVMPAL